MITGFLSLALCSAPLVPIWQADPDENPPPFPSFTIRPDGVVLENLQSRQIVDMAALEYAAGVKFRHDERLSRRRFVDAARMYDEVWRRGYRDPELALARANSRRLAGNLPGTIAALNEGLLTAPWNRPLQIALEDARSAVAYPIHSELESLCRPRVRTTISTRMSAVEARWLAGGLWLLACCSITRFAMTRTPGWLIFAAACVVALALFGGLWWYDDLVRCAEAEHPLVIVTENVDLLRGNSRVFAKRLEGAPPLPKGVEARELSRRGGWVQIRLHRGDIGWIPESATLKVGG